MLNEEELRDGVLLFANKQDLPSAMRRHRNDRAI